MKPLKIWKLNLKVEIPIRFKDQLMIRFDMRKLDKDGINYVSCPLCKEYAKCRSSNVFEDCLGCPFNAFKIHGDIVGCDEWIKKVLNEDEILFASGLGKVIASHPEEREQIKRLKKKARKLITWI